MILYGLALVGGCATIGAIAILISIAGEKIEKRGGQMNKSKREAVYQKYGGHCAYCGKEIAYKDMQVDPLEPQNKGGANDMDNLMPSCRRCNHYKRANNLEGFRKMIEEIPGKLEVRNYIYRVALDYSLVEAKPHKIKFYFEEVEK